MCASGCESTERPNLVLPGQSGVGGMDQDGLVGHRRAETSTLGLPGSVSEVNGLAIFEYFTA